MIVVSEEKVNYVTAIWFMRTLLDKKSINLPEDIVLEFPSSKQIVKYNYETNTLGRYVKEDEQNER
jgi:hypothetical protein